MGRKVELRGEEKGRDEDRGVFWGRGKRKKGRICDSFKRGGKADLASGRKEGGLLAYRA